MNDPRIITNYTVDPKRRSRHYTGVYVRAKDGERWDSFDVGELDAASLKAWLRSRDGDNPWAESFVLRLLGHETPADASD